MKINTTQISTEYIQSNDYNSNIMTEDGFQELINEVRKLGRVPKPIVIRRDTKNNGKYIIIDGEHNWLAAKEVGLDQVTCEIIEADDFEAMQQSYKRNQHGKHIPVKLGQMFQKMMKIRGLSLRDMAKETDLSKDTIRDYLLYAKASEELALDYDEVNRLTVRQIRWYDVLPKPLGSAWINDGANVKDITDNSHTHWQISHELGLDQVKAYYQKIAENGFLDYLNWNDAKRGLKKVFKKIIEWEKWENSWAHGGIERKELRKYTKWYFEKKWVVREMSLMDSALKILIDAQKDPAEFRITPDEFESVINETTIQRDSASLFQKKLRAVIAQKTGQIVKDEFWAKDVLMETELNNAPEYIKNCKKYTEFKFALWKAEKPPDIDVDSFEKAKQEIAETGYLYYLDWQGYDLKKAIDWQIEFNVEKHKFKKEISSKSVKEFATIIVNGLNIYDSKKEYDKWKSLLHKFMALTKEELYVVNESIRYTDLWAAEVVKMKEKINNIGGLGELLNVK